VRSEGVVKEKEVELGGGRKGYVVVGGAKDSLE
jgi:hypothetical protein